MMHLPVSTGDLLEYLPHRPPMVWVDTVDQVTDAGGTCSVHHHPEALYCGPTGIRWSAPIEWMAQAYGFVKAVQAATGLIELSEMPKVTFLAQISDAQTTTPLEGKYFSVEVTLRRALGPMSLVNGVVRREDGSKVASASLKLFAQ